MKKLRIDILGTEKLMDLEERRWSPDMFSLDIDLRLFSFN